MSILDGIYWENEYRKEEERKSKEQKNKIMQDNFNGKMPCNKCNIKDMCKYALTIEFVNYNKELFNIEITCNNFR